MILRKIVWLAISILSLSGCGGVEGPGLSSDATLSFLSASAGTLSPGFRSGVTGYDVVVNALVASIAITPTTSHSAATVTVAGNTVLSGAASPSIALASGENSVNLLVTAENRSTARTYTLTIYRSRL